MAIVAMDRELDVGVKAGAVDDGLAADVDMGAGAGAKGGSAAEGG
jgi:hypothetical protein